MKSLLFLLAVGTAIAANAADESPHTKSGGAGIREAGLAYAKQIFPKAMKDPASTTFDAESVTSDHKVDTKDKETGEPISVYCVKGIVRSKNSFAAVVPSEWCLFVIEREKTTEMAIATLEGKIIAKTEMGERLMVFFQKTLEAKDAKEREKTLARIAEAKRKQEEQKAKAAGNDLGKLHGTRMGKQARTLADKEIARRAKKFAADAGYSDDGLASQFVEGYAAAIAAAAD